MSTPIKKEKIDETERSESSKKLKTRKRKRKSSSSGSDSDELKDLPENCKVVEQKLIETAVKNNLDDQSVKKILKKVVTNDHVLALVKLREEEELQKEVTDVKITRAKAKELIKESPAKVPPTAPWNLDLQPIKQIPVKTRPEVTALIDQELPDESDDEYQPTKDDVPSDDDQTLESCSDIDSLPRTPASEPPASPISAHKDDTFKVPLTPKRKEEAEPTIALRTRSKFSLSSTPIETIEESFVPPDVPPLDESRDETCGDNLWTDFLTEVLNPAPTPVDNEDDEADPEYNYAADQENSDDDETIEGRIMRITQSEINDLVKELFNDLPDQEMLSAAISPKSFDNQVLDKENQSVTQMVLAKSAITTSGKLENSTNASVELPNPPETNENVTIQILAQAKAVRVDSEIAKEASGKSVKDYVMEDLERQEKELESLQNDSDGSNANNESDSNSEASESELVIEEKKKKTMDLDKNKKPAKKPRNPKRFASDIRWNDSLAKKLSDSRPIFMKRNPRLNNACAVGDEVPCILRRLLRNVGNEEKFFTVMDVKPPIPPKDLEIYPEQLEILKQQMRMHVQLCTVTYLQIYPHPAYWKYAKNYKKLLEDLKEKSKDKPNSYFCPVNLPPSLQLVDAWENSLNEKSKEAVEMVEFIQDQIERASKVVTKSRAVWKFPKLFLETVAMSTGVVLYPYLLPPIPFRSDSFMRTIYLPSEDKLIAMGLEQFFDYVQKNPSLYPGKKVQTSCREVCRLICTYMLPTMEYKRLVHHVSVHRHKDVRDPSPIQLFFNYQKIESVRHVLFAFNETFTLDQHPPNELPLIWAQYLSKNCPQIKHMDSKHKRIGGSKPEGVVVPRLMERDTVAQQPIAPKLTSSNANGGNEPMTFIQIPVLPLGNVIPVSTTNAACLTTATNIVSSTTGAKVSTLITAIAPKPTPILATNGRKKKPRIDHATVTLMPKDAAAIETTAREGEKPFEPLEGQRFEDIQLAEKPEWTYKIGTKTKCTCNCKILDRLEKNSKISHQKRITDYFKSPTQSRQPKEACRRNAAIENTAKMKILREMCGTIEETPNRLADRLLGRFEDADKFIKSYYGGCRIDSNNSQIPTENVNKEELEDRLFVLSLLRKIELHSILEPRIPSLATQFVHLVRTTRWSQAIYTGFCALFASNAPLQSDMLHLLTPEQAVLVGKYKEYILSLHFERIVEAIESCIRPGAPRRAALLALRRSLLDSDNNPGPVCSKIFGQLTSNLVPFAFKYAPLANALLKALPHVYIQELPEPAPTQRFIPTQPVDTGNANVATIEPTQSREPTLDVAEASSAPNNNGKESMPLIEIDGTLLLMKAQSDMNQEDEMTIEPETLTRADSDHKPSPSQSLRLHYSPSLVSSPICSPIHEQNIWTREEDRILLETVKDRLANNALDILSVVNGGSASEDMYKYLLSIDKLKDRNREELLNRVVTIMQFLISNVNVKEEI